MNREIQFHFQVFDLSSLLGGEDVNPVGEEQGVEGIIYWVFECLASISLTASPFPNGEHLFLLG